MSDFELDKRIKIENWHTGEVPEGWVVTTAGVPAVMGDRIGIYIEVDGSLKYIYAGKFVTKDEFERLTRWRLVDFPPTSSKPSLDSEP